MGSSHEQKNGKKASPFGNKPSRFGIALTWLLWLVIIGFVIFHFAKPYTKNGTPQSQPTEVATISATSTPKPKPTEKSPKPTSEPTVNLNEVRFYKRQAMQAYLQPIMNDLSKTHEAILSMQVAGTSGDLYAVKSSCEDGARAAQDAELEASTGIAPAEFSIVRVDLIAGAGELKRALFACQNALEGNGMSLKGLVENQRNMDEGNSDIKAALESARLEYVEFGGLANDVPDIRSHASE
jgi:hypothetical protein